MALLGEVALVIDCEHKTAPRSESEAFGYSIGTGAVRDGRILLEKAKPVDRSTYNEWTRRATPAFGDLIFSREAPMGEVGAVPPDTALCLGQRTVLLRLTSDQVNIAFLKYALQAPVAQKWIKNNSSGTTVQHLNVGDVRRLPLPFFPSLDEQYRIVETLEDHLSRLDAAQACMNTSLRKIAVLREETIVRAITGAGIPQHSAPKLAPVGTSDGDLASLPVGWDWARLGDVADVVGGVTKDSKKQSDPDYVEVPYLRVANVQRGRLDLNSVTTLRVASSKADSLRLLPGDVLLNEGGDRDKLARGWVWEGQVDRCIHQNHVFRARIRDSRLDPYFLSYTANSIGGKWAEKNGKQSTNLASISLSMIRKMPVIVPAPDVAVRVVDDLNARLDSYARMSDEIVNAGRRHQALRRSLLAAAFSGHLVNDFSAEVSAEQLVLV